MARDTPEPDDKLVEAINAGDSAAFETLYRRYRDWVVSLAYRFTGNHDDALDVLQDTFLYLAGKFPGFRLTAKLTTFLYPAVRHLSLAMRRRRQRFAGGEEMLLQEPAPPPRASSAASRAELAAVVAVLPSGQREVLLMRFVDAMSLEEIAAALGIPLGTVKSRLHNALRMLREDERTRRYFEE